MEPRIEEQELYCHNCDGYVQFVLDLSTDGNYVLECPNCGHEHCRVVRGGIITDLRWDQRNGNPVINNNVRRITFVTYSGSSNLATQTYGYDSTGGWTASSTNSATWNSGTGWAS